MRTKRTKKTATDVELAYRWGCNERTIRRWRVAGAPLGNDARMRDWLAGQKNIGVGTRAVLEAQPSIPNMSGNGVVAVPLPAGAAYALKRLEETEAKMFQALEAATATGDAGKIRFCRDGWLKCSEQLRRHDLAVEANRRVAGELLPREKLEYLAAEFAGAWFFCTQTVFREAAYKFHGLPVEEISVGLDALRHTTLSSVRAWLHRQRDDDREIPDWLIEQLTMGNNRYQPYAEMLPKLAIAMQEMMKNIIDLDLERHRKQVAKQNEINEALRKQEGFEKVSRLTTEYNALPRPCSR